MSTNEAGFSTEEFEVARAVRAKAVLTDPMVVEALSAIRNATRDLFFETAPEDAQTRERLHMLHDAQRRFESVFTTMIMSGEIARATLLGDSQQDEAVRALQQRAKER